MKKILLLGPDLDNRGGMAVSERMLIEGLRERDHEVVHISTHRDGGALTKLRTFFHALMKYGKYVTGKTDFVVLIFFVSGASFYRKSIFVLLASLFRRRVVLDCHLGGFDEFYFQAYGLARWYIKKVLNLADGIVVLGKSEIAGFKKICSVTHYEVIPNTIVCSDVAASLEADPPTVVTLGTLGKRKGTYDLLDVIPKVLEVIPGAQFILAGDGEVEPCAGIVKSKGFEANVHFPGYIGPDERNELLLKAWVFVLPSYYEGMPWSILEAMSYGVPVVASGINTIPDLVKDGVCGFLITPGDVEKLAQRITQLLTDGQLRRNFGGQARRIIAEEYAPLNLIDRLVSFLFSGENDR